MHTLVQLRKLTRKHLLLGSMTVPREIINEHGRVDLADGRVICVPALRDAAKACISAYFEAQNLKVHNINMAEPHPWMLGEAFNYAPWWWLWTPETLQSLCEAAGMRVVKPWTNWVGNADYLWCQID